MEGEVDWEVEYRELKRRVDHVLMPLLEKALRYVPDDFSEEGAKRQKKAAHPYSTEIAPWESSYPLILRLANPEERARMFLSAQKKISPEGVWIGAEAGSEGHRRPQIGMATLRAKEQQANGERPKHLRKNRVTSVYQPTSPFPATHVLLVGHGFYPEEGDVGSHLCHHARCVNINHLVWESSARNNRRENACNKKRVCACGLQPPCNFGQH